MAGLTSTGQALSLLAVFMLLIGFGMLIVLETWPTFG